MRLPLGVDLGNSLDSFRHGAEEFFHRLADIGWPSMVIALVFYLAHLLARSRAWQNTLRAAYPDRSVPYAQIAAAYLVGAGMNSIVPARVGDAVKIFLAKRSIRRSTYTAVGSSFFVGSVCDTAAARAPRPACSRHPLLGAAPKPAAVHPARPRDRDRARLRPARPPGGAVL